MAAARTTTPYSQSTQQPTQLQVQFFHQDDLANVAKTSVMIWYVMLGADSGDQSQTSDQP